MSVCVLCVCARMTSDMIWGAARGKGGWVRRNRRWAAAAFHSALCAGGLVAERRATARHGRMCQARAGRAAEGCEPLLPQLWQGGASRGFEAGCARPRGPRTHLKHEVRPVRGGAQQVDFERRQDVLRRAGRRAAHEVGPPAACGQQRQQRMAGGGPHTPRTRAATARHGPADV